MCRLEKFRSQNVQIFGYVFQDTSGQNHGPAWKTQSFLSNEICMVILWQDHHGKGNSRKSFWTTVGRKFRIGNVFCQPSKRTILLSVYVDDIKLAGKTEDISPTWKILVKDVDLGEPTSFLDHMYLGCAQRERMPNKQGYCGKL